MGCGHWLKSAVNTWFSQKLILRSMKNPFYIIILDILVSPFFKEELPLMETSEFMFSVTSNQLLYLIDLPY